MNFFFIPLIINHVPHFPFIDPSCPWSNPNNWVVRPWPQPPQNRQKCRTTNGGFPLPSMYNYPKCFLTGKNRDPIRGRKNLTNFCWATSKDAFQKDLTIIHVAWSKIVSYGYESSEREWNGGRSTSVISTSLGFWVTPQLCPGRLRDWTPSQVATGWGPQDM